MPSRSFSRRRAAPSCSSRANESRLQEIARDFATRHGVEVFVAPFDLSQPDAPTLLYAAMQDLGLHIDTLVNNAGFATHGFFAETELGAQLAEVQVDVVALTHLTRLFLPAMLQAGSGGILNVASTAAYVPGPLMAIYYASKAYVLSLSEALSNEVEGTGVTVTCLVPGPTRTEFGRRAKLEGTRLFKGRTMSAEEVARAGYDGLYAGERVVIPGLRNRLLSLAARLAPREMSARMARSSQEMSK